MQDFKLKSKVERLKTDVTNFKFDIGSRNKPILIPNQDIVPKTLIQKN